MQAVNKKAIFNRGAVFLVKAVFKSIAAVGFSLSFLLLSNNIYASQEWIEQFAADVKHANRKEKIPGYAFAIVKPDANVEIFTNGLTHAKGKPIDENTLFRLASVSKTFTSVLTAKLVQQGHMKWNLPIQQLVPEVSFKANLGTEITLQHILSQSTGYMPNAYDNLIEANYSVERVLRQLAKLEPICQPGKCYTYQNTLFAAVDKGLYQQTEKNYKTLLQEQIFEPLDMATASVGLKPLINGDNWARPHAKVRKGRYVQTRVKPAYYRYASASGINASITDMSKWLKLMLGHYPGVLSDYQIEKLIEPKTITTKELYRKHWQGHLNTAHYGLGWRVYDFEGEQLVHHGGWVSGYRADITFAPEFGVGLVLLMNAESNLINKFRVNFWENAFTKVRKKPKRNDQQAIVSGYTYPEINRLIETNIEFKIAIEC